MIHFSESDGNVQARSEMMARGNDHEKNGRSRQEIDNQQRSTFAHWLPWERFREQVDFRRPNRRWLIGKYARRCLRAVPGCLEWPIRPLPVLDWDQVNMNFIFNIVLFLSMCKKNFETNG